MDYVKSVNSLSSPRSSRFSLMIFFPKSFIVVHFIFKSMIHSESVLCKV